MKRVPRARRAVVFAMAVLVVAGALIIIGRNMLDGVVLKIIPRVESDVHMIERALEAYYVDYKAYPSSAAQLTSPTEYMLGLISDPFHPDKYDPYNPGKNAYAYKSNGSKYIISSHGPDQDVDLTPTEIWDREGKTIVSRVSYDPSNGAMSSGDIIVYGPAKPRRTP